MPKISVIIPCYNASAYISRCLDALENQIYRDFDVILVDDCSGDNTIQVIEQYRKTSSMPLLLLKNTINSGPAAARKIGLMASNSSFICFCDSDDWYDADYLQEMVKAQAENNADMVFCSFRLLFDSGKKTNRLIIYEKSDLLDNRRIMVKAPDSLCLMMFKRDILLSVPYPDMRNGEDMALIPLLVSQSNTFSAVNKCLYNYYCRMNSASMGPTMKMIESLEASFSFISQNLSSDYQEEKEFLGIRNLLYGALLNLFKFSNNREKANQIIDGFEKTFPLWSRNSNMNELSFTKRLFLSCVKYRRWFLVRVLSQIHRVLLQNG